MNKRTVDISNYWITIVRDTAQFGQIAVAENPEFNMLAECIFNTLEDTFIQSASEYGVKRWESMLQIAPSASDTLDERKARILTYLNLKLPYTWRVLNQLISTIVDDDRYYITYDNDTQKLYIEIKETSREKVADLVSRVVPMNLEVIYLPWRWKYEHCKNVNDMIAVNPDYKTDLTPDGKWVYELPGITNGDKLFQYAQIEEFAIREIPNPNNAYFAFSGNKKIKRFYTRLPKMAWFDRTFHNTSLEVFDYNGETFSPGVISLAFNDSKSFRTFNAVFGKKISNAELAFSNCILDKASVLRIANSALPASSGVKITMGVHVDHQNDAEVLAALDTMTANGWTVARQWNGTPTSTASTFGFKRIWVRKVESEQGEYVAQDGTRWRVEWCDMLSAPDGSTPEDHGYELFRSVDAAVAYWELELLPEEGVEQ